MGDFAEAAAAAAKALQLDPKERKARYVLGMALMRLGRTQEGQKELEEFSKQEAQAQRELDNERDVVVSSRGAAAFALSGQAEDAIASFQKSIQAHPGVAALQLNFGIALGLLGRHREAASVLKELIDRGSGENFVIYKALAREYESLKDDKMSQRYDALYVRSVDASLEEELR
jgi:predicted Zn-dependent protease